MSQANYEASLRSAVRGLWSGVYSVADFFSIFQSAIRRNLTRAWHEGAAACGIKPEELTTAETLALQTLIVNEEQYVFGFALDVEAGSKAAGVKLSRHFARVPKWGNRYNEARTRGEAMACADKKKKWKLGAAEHCKSCVKLDGKVKRNSFWIERGILPNVAGASYLDCKGYECKCSLEDTDDPVSRGPLPKLP